MNKNLKVLLLTFSAMIILTTSLLIIFNNNEQAINNNAKLKIVTTLFPQYDFARQIGGNLVDVTLLLPPGSESHTYEPSVSDISLIENADIFIYTGENMEAWAKQLSSNITSDVKIIDISQGINLIEKKHEHTQVNSHAHHDFSYDPHIWMSPTNAIYIINNILNELTNIDSENQNYYLENANKYINQIEDLHKEFLNIKNIANKNSLVFASPFSYIYFTELYELNYISAYDFCGESAEPSASKIKEIIDYIKINNIKYIFCDNMASRTSATTISNETRANILEFYGIHSISKTDLENNESYVSLMTKNLENLKIALNITEVKT